MLPNNVLTHPLLETLGVLMEAFRLGGRFNMET